MNIQMRFRDVPVDDEVLFERILVVAALATDLTDEGVPGAVRAAHVALHVDLLHKPTSHNVINLAISIKYS